jgi:Flp pilus assembly protein TadG
MSFRAGAQELFARVRTGVRAGVAGFGRDRRGIAAIEFALIAPILLALYFLTMEASQAIETNKKLNRVSSMVADLVTQQQGAVTKDDLDAIMKIADSTLLPYQRSKPTIIITGIKISDEASPKATVDWSRKVVNGASSAAEAKDSKITVPASLLVKNTFLVRVEGQLAYKPVITWSANDKSFLGLTGAFDSISMGETYYMRPRMTAAITCSDCYK